jgi:ribose 5-phosphate isomerase A
MVLGMNAKQRAAEAALAFLENGMVVGLGTGTTADFFLQGLAAALAEGRLQRIVGVPTSRQSEHRALELGIPLTTFSRSRVLDLTIDGADEIDPNLDLIKGLGGALVREKIVAQNSRRFVIIADASKFVPTLGVKGPLPVEVLPFAQETQEGFFRSLGAEPTLRRVGGMIVNTDNGNLIYDCKFPQIANPAEIDRRISQRAGIVGTGLFIGLASTVLIADEKAVTRYDRKV